MGVAECFNFCHGCVNFFEPLNEPLLKFKKFLFPIELAASSIRRSPLLISVNLLCLCESVSELMRSSISIAPPSLLVLNRGNADKICALRKLAAVRVKHDLSTLRDHYQQPENIGCGLEFEDYVSPWTKGANNVDSEIFLLAQDWSSTDALKAASEDDLEDLRTHGRLRSLPTNKNICWFLQESFDIPFTDCFATNAFVFLKKGSISARIPACDLTASITDYTLPQIKIVQPKLVLCLGAGVFAAIEQILRRDMYHSKKVHWKDSLDKPLKFGQSIIVALPHPGGRATASLGGKHVVVRTFWQEPAKKNS